MNIKNFIRATATSLILISPGFAQISQTPTVQIPQQSQAIDLAICLDTSGSMEKLIDAARQKIWDIVNELALAKPAPRLRVALLTFGNNGHSEEVGWVKVDSGLTEDLDLISQQLFSYTTNGGEEYVGRVIQASLQQLQWSQDPNALKIIVVAGNESADQDKAVPYREQCKTAIAQGIMINSIYCGDEGDAIAQGWRQVSLLADGHFAAIDHESGPVTILTPFDEAMTALSANLNETYLPYGRSGEAFASNQIAQDKNAAECNSGVSASRAWSKSNLIYNCSSWDLVDALAEPENKIDLATIAAEELPEVMQQMSTEERYQFVEEKRQARGKIQKEIAGLNQKREQFIRAERDKLSAENGRSFDAAMRTAIRQQATQKGFDFKPQTVKL